MPGDETRTKHAGEESESEDESDVEPVVKVEIDPSKLTPLSPEVISKQVRLRELLSVLYAGVLIFGCVYRLRLTWVRPRRG